MNDIPLSLEEQFRQKLTEEKEIVERTILNGGLTPAKYDWLTGQLSGIRIAESYFQELIDAWKNQE